LNCKEILASLRGLKVIDLSPMFDTNMPGWSTHPTMGIIRDARNFEQNGYFAETLVMSEHTGSHVDAPAHVVQSMPGATIDTFPPDVLIGPYKKYDLESFQLKAGELVTLEMIKSLEQNAKFTVERGDIVLLEYGWDRYFYSKDPEQRAWWGRNMPGLSEEVCKYLAEARIRAIGSDTASTEQSVVEGVFKSTFGHTKYFLPNQILIMEGLTNLASAPTTGIFMALPLKIKGGSGSPIRPIVLVPS
jgi:arylformamidase